MSLMNIESDGPAVSEKERTKAGATPQTSTVAASAT